MKRFFLRAATSVAITAALAGAVAFAVMALGQGRRFERAFDEMVNGLRVTVLDLNGNVVSDTVGAVSGDHSKREEFREALATGVGTAVRKSASTGAYTIYSARQIGPHILRCAIPFNRLRQLQAVDRRGDLTAALAVLFALVFTFVLVLRMNRRVAQLAAERDAERRRGEEAERMARFRRDFVADFSHELRTPLTGIMGAAEMLAADSPAISAESRRRLSDTLCGESRRLEALSREVLQLAELDAAEVKTVEGGKTRLDEAVRREICELMPVAAREGVELAVDAVPRLETAVPRHYVGRILSNLVINAVRYASASRISVSLDASGGYAHLKVADDGVGIAAEHLPRLFERFYRVDKARSRSRGGSGLGLAIVKHTAEAFGGTVEVRSTLGAGTEFTVRLPLA